MPTLPTGALAELLGTPPHRLAYLTRDRQVRPRKSGTGAFEWSLDEARAAARRLGVHPPTHEAFELAVRQVEAVVEIDRARGREGDALPVATAHGEGVR